ncbi:hypothetical protein [Pseudomonas sp. LTJR-52]|nr:hypothetical protein [Pseudomonas sp. LTJR-52]
MTTQQIQAEAMRYRQQAAAQDSFVAAMLIERAEELERKAQQGRRNGSR